MYLWMIITWQHCTLQNSMHHIDVNERKFASFPKFLASTVSGVPSLSLIFPPRASNSTKLQMLVSTDLLQVFDTSLAPPRNFRTSVSFPCERSFVHMLNVNTSSGIAGMWTSVLLKGSGHVSEIATFCKFLTSTMSGVPSLSSIFPTASNSTKLQMLVSTDLFQVFDTSLESPRIFRTSVSFPCERSFVHMSNLNTWSGIAGMWSGNSALVKRSGHVSKIATFAKFLTSTVSGVPSLSSIFPTASNLTNSSMIVSTNLSQVGDTFLTNNISFRTSMSLPDDIEFIHMMTRSLWKSPPTCLVKNKLPGACVLGLDSILVVCSICNHD